jgi:hypothetical protein
MPSLAVLVAPWPTIAPAETWIDLQGPATAAASGQRVLVCPDKRLQDFFADGRTLHGNQWGR